MSRAGVRRARMPLLWASPAMRSVLLVSALPVEAEGVVAGRGDAVGLGRARIASVCVRVRGPHLRAVELEVLADML